MEALPDNLHKKAAKIARACFFIAMIGFAFCLVLYSGFLVYAKILGAPPLAVQQSSLFYSADGSIIAESNNGQERYWVQLKDISPHLVQSVIAVEDQHFYKHNGFDYKRIAGALVADLKAGSKVQGASTITQQYARNLFLSHEKTWYRKMNEAFYTKRIELNYTKDEILEGYLNTIYFGHGAYGVQAASQYYFGKDAADLTVAEAAMLAGIPKGPSYFSPFASWEKSKDRQSVVLAALKNSGYISKAEIQAISEEEIALSGVHKQREDAAPYFTAAVKQALQTDLGLDEKDLAMGGLRVYTTLDLNMQKAAEDAFAANFSADTDIQGALVAMDPDSGEVTSLVGGRDYRESPFNRATQAIRQPGSTIKPILYYAALEHGFTPATMLKSEATTFTFSDGHAPYKPNNFNSQYADKEITLAEAIALSDNVYAVKTHLFLGEKKLNATAKRFGIKSEMDTLPSSALGTSGVKVIEMVNAYGILANGGKAIKPRFIKRVENYRGEVLYQAPGQFERAIDPDLAFVMTGMLTGVFNEQYNGHATVTGATIIPKLTRQYAGKSGSTKTDSWMIGYTPDLVAGVWTGYDQGKLIESAAEKKYAKTVWADFMEESLKKSKFSQFTPASKNVVAVQIDPETGKLATSNCPEAVLTYFTKGSEPEESCTVHAEDHKPEEPKKEKDKKKPWYKKWMPFL